MIRATRPNHWSALAAITCWWFLSAATPSHGQIVGPSHPTTPIQSRDLSRLGLTASVELSQQLGPGYVAVRIVVQGIGTVPVDRRLTFQFATNAAGEAPPGNGLVINVPITVPQGSTTTEITRYFPKWTLGQFTNIRVFEEERSLEESATKIGEELKASPINRSTNSWSQTTRANRAFQGLASECFQDWLFVVGHDQPVLDSVPDLSGIPNDIRGDARLSTRGVLMGITGDPALRQHAVPSSQLPHDWRGYRQYDVVAMSTQVQSELATNHPQAIGALRQWILQGGVAIVFDADRTSEIVDRWNFARIGNDNRSLVEFTASRARWARERKEVAEELRSRLTEAEPPSFDELQRFAMETNPDAFSPSLDPARANDAMTEFFDTVIEDLAARINDPASQLANQIEIQNVAAGTLITIDRDANVPAQPGATPSELHWALVKRMIRDRCSPMLRQGTEPVIGHPRFRTWAIAGVLQPPVYSFMGILSLFVVLVGPVAYRQTSKHGRSHLMFVIAPALAIITTLAMLAYGVIADGFGTQIRARQLTWVDGKSGDSGERVRASYFAGIRPASGLRFPGSATVNRQLEANDLSWHQVNQAPPSLLGTITVTPEAQWFDTSFLPSRDQRQFVTHCPRMGIGSLELFEPESEGRPARITSTFSFPLRDLIVRDNQGNYWFVDQLDANGSRDGESIGKNVASRRLAEMFNAYRPLAEASNRESGRSDRNRNDDLDIMKEITQYLEVPPNTSVGEFEDWLSRRLQIAGEIPNQHFIATSDVSDDVLAVPGDLVDSVRYVFGTLR